MKMFNGSMNDKASVKELIDDVLIEKCLYLMDRGFHCPEMKEKIAQVQGTYIMPVCSHMNSYKEAMKRGPGRLKTFLYKHRDGIHMERDKVEYRVSSESSGTRVIYYRNLQQALEESSSYSARIEEKVPGYSEEDWRKLSRHSGDRSGNDTPRYSGGNLQSL